MGLKEKAEKLKKKKSVSKNATVTDAGLTDDTQNRVESSSFGTIAALIIGALGIILLKGRKT